MLLWHDRLGFCYSLLAPPSQPFSGVLILVAPPSSPRQPRILPPRPATPPPLAPPPCIGQSRKDQAHWLNLPRPPPFDGVLGDLVVAFLFVLRPLLVLPLLLTLLPSSFWSPTPSPLLPRRNSQCVVVVVAAHNCAPLQPRSLASLPPPLPPSPRPSALAMSGVFLLVCLRVDPRTSCWPLQRADV